MKIKKICTLHFPASSSDEGIPLAQRLAEIFTADEGWSEVAPNLFLSTEALPQNRSWINPSAPLGPRSDLQGDDLLISFSDDSGLDEGDVLVVAANNKMPYSRLEADELGGLSAKFKAGLLLQEVVSSKANIFKIPGKLLDEAYVASELTSSGERDRVEILVNLLKMLDIPEGEESQATPQDTEIPGEVSRAFTQAFQELVKEVGEEEAVKLVRDNVANLLTSGAIQKVIATKEISTLEVEEWLKERNIRKERTRLNELLENFPVISPIDAKNKIGTLIDRILSQRVSYLIRRKGVDLAVLCPYREVGEVSKEDTITSQDVAKQRHLFDTVKTGKRYRVVRRDLPVALLIPPISENYDQIKQIARNNTGT